MTWRACAIFALCASACTSSPTAEHTANLRQDFASAGATMVDLDFDATLTADTVDPPQVRKLIAAQLMYLVGQLNEDRSVGYQYRAQFDVTTFGQAATPGDWVFTYHVTIPVAWGAGAPPARYDVSLPARVGESDQVAFAEKYGVACSDPEGGIAGGADAGRMFLFFRPRRAGCALAPADVVTTTATVKPSAANTTGKYPEYHRVWDDDELDVVAIFGQELDGGGAADGGIAAYEGFLASANAWAGSTMQTVDAGGLRSARITRELDDGRRVDIETILVPPHLTEQRTAFDDWYDARSAGADLIIYSGHAGLGSNARLFTTKGVFRANKYVVMAINGCDTLAYLDRTLAERRAPLNPDDPSGTKYMDTLTNVLGGYFHSGDDTSMHLVKAFVGALDTPQTFAEVLDGIDPSQIMIVTGEEDNVFQPGMIPKKTTTTTENASSSGGEPSGAPAGGDAPARTSASDAAGSSASSCDVATRPPHAPFALGVALCAAGVLAARRSRRRS